MFPICSQSKDGEEPPALVADLLPDTILYVFTTFWSPLACVTHAFTVLLPSDFTATFGVGVAVIPNPVDANVEAPVQ